MGTDKKFGFSGKQYLTDVGATLLSGNDFIGMSPIFSSLSYCKYGSNPPRLRGRRRRRCAQL